MKKVILFSVLLLLCVSGSLAQVSRIHPYLQNKISAASERSLSVYAVLAERISIDYLQGITSGLSKKEKQQEIVRILQEFAAAKQSNLLARLNELKAAGSVRNINVIWALNTVAFEAAPQIISVIANDFPEIEMIYYDPKFPVSEVTDEDRYYRDHPMPISLEPRAPQPGLTLINAPQVWAQGDSGRGILVGNLDTGVDWHHPDLVKNMWCNPGEDFNGNGTSIIWNGSAYVFDPGDINGIDDDLNGLIDDLVGWDYSQNDKDPYNGSSSSYHGTQTSGLVMGDGTNGTQTGVAPRAKMLSLVPSGESQYWSAQQYCIAKGVDVITSSLSYKWYFSPQPNYPMFRQMTDLELAAGIIHTNSTSNDGGNSSAPIPFNIATPGNCPGPWIHPDQTLVGGMSSVIGSANVLASTDVIVSSSPYGPATWENIQQLHPSYPYVMPQNYRDYPYETSPGSIGLLKPDVSAPGNGTVSTYPGGGYQSFSGTSGATPHLAGVAALMLGADNTLTPADVSRIMQLTSVDKGPTGKDNRYGAGRVDALAAYNMVMSEIPVELVSFNAEISGGNVILSWITATETNNSGFRIEREFLGKKENIAFIPGKINSTTTSAYSYTDNVSSGIYTYRLKQVDLDGSVNYAKEVTVSVNNPSHFEVAQNYPNPFNPATIIKFTVPEDGFVNLSVYNMLGETVAQPVNQHTKAGSYSITFDGSNLTSGVYFYTLKNGNNVQTRKMILAK